MESADEFSNENNTKASMTKEETSEHLEQSTGSGRRRQTTKNESGITLVPQPTDDPRDPLVSTTLRPHIMSRKMCFLTLYRSTELGEMA